MQGVQKTLKPQKVRGVVQWERKQRAVVGAATFRMSGPQPTVVHGQQALFGGDLENTHPEHQCVEHVRQAYLDPLISVPGHPLSPSRDETLMWCRCSLGIL